MTAEVAVLNKSAVALAADSAMSVGYPRKTYPTNKLFALTKHHPIAVMIYHNASFMDIPWETIVKMYRKEIGLEHRATVKEYAEDFLGYVGNATICTDSQRDANLHRIGDDLFLRIAQDAAQRLSDPSNAGDSDPSGVIREVVERHSSAFADAGEAPSMQGVDVNGLVRTHEDHLNALIDRRFARHTIDGSVRQSLLAVVDAAIGSLRLSSGFSGLVFAGFGNDEILPSLVEIMTDGAVGDVVKADIRTGHDLARMGTHTVILPFAQSEMVERFMEGIDPDFSRYVNNYFVALFTNVAREILESTIPGGSPSDEQVTELQRLVDRKLDQFREDTQALRQDAFINPILEIVQYLPKEELASMAEALVSLTSLKRRVSTEEESVGGPIDVAVVSKGDGFVWIKRKHYFDVALNRDYVVRQSRSHVGNSGGENGL